MNELEQLRQENLHLRCVLLEAAKELSAHWESHTHEGGLGPFQLLDYLAQNTPITAEKNPYPHNVVEALKK